VSNIDGEILGISESGRMYKYYAALAGGSLRYNACWELEIESPVVDNSASGNLTNTKASKGMHSSGGSDKLKDFFK